MAGNSHTKISYFECKGEGLISTWINITLDYQFLFSGRFVVGLAGILSNIIYSFHKEIFVNKNGFIKKQIAAIAGPCVAKFLHLCANHCIKFILQIVECYFLRHGPWQHGKTVHGIE